MKFTITIAIAAAIVAASLARADDGLFPQEHYGYITQNAEYDSAFFYAIRGDPNATVRAAAPLVMFLQGGPGATSLFSDYLETGPERLHLFDNAQGYALSPREHAWTKHATMLYVDNPIGTGFSYTRDPRGFSTTDRDIADKLVDFIGKFFLKHTEYANTSFWIFCESYGGKMTAYTGAALARAIAAGALNVKFMGVEIGDGWVAPCDCMDSYASYLETFSQISPAQAANISEYAQFARDALEEGNGTLATFWWGAQQDVISAATGNINWYNALYYYDYTADVVLDIFLANNFTAKIASIIPPGVSYNAQSNDVFNYLQGAFMDDGIAQVDEILAAGYQVHVLTGQVDLIVDVVCMQSWVAKLEWPGLSTFWQQPRVPIVPNHQLNVGGFVQSYKNFNIWQVNLAGHMVPLDNPPVAEIMVATIVGSLRATAPATSSAKEAVVHVNTRDRRLRAKRV